MLENVFFINYSKNRYERLVLCHNSSIRHSVAYSKGASGDTCPRAHQHTFCSHLKHFLSRNLYQSMLKNAYFLKTVKNCLSVWADSVGLQRLGDPHPDPHIVTPAYYYNFVKFIFSTKCVLLLSKKRTIFTSSNFCAYFSLQTL